MAFCSGYLISLGDNGLALSCTRGFFEGEPKLVDPTFLFAILNNTVEWIHTLTNGGKSSLGKKLVHFAGT